MLGKMMHQSLLVSSLLTHAERHHGGREIVSSRVEGDIHRYGYRDLAERSRRLANVMSRLGLARSDRVGSLAWNTYRHMELYYGVSGAGQVLHTLNPRLHPEQLSWIVADAQDKVLFFDLTFLPLVEAVAPALTSVTHFVLMADADRMPAKTSIPNLLCYETLLAEAPEDFRWPQFDENTASLLCYTSGTTGNPKGVLYSHRSQVLHAYGAALPDCFGITSRDVILPIVPMFHVNAWGMPYMACVTGAKLVMPGPHLDGKSLHDLFEAEGVTFSAGVPTVAQGLLSHVETHGLGFSSLDRIMIGGATCPPALMHAFEEQFGVTVIHGWGMTELSPMGSVSKPKGGQEGLDQAAAFALKTTQGRSLFGVDMKIVDPDGKELPWDGESRGELLVRGPWVIQGYFNRDEDPLRYDEAGQGWFPTGDVSTITPDGFMQIVDRIKDVIKSGGEWISSIELENIAVAHPAVAMAACIAARHPKWGERPLLLVTRKSGAELDRDQLMAFMEDKVAKWWMPDDVLFVDQIHLGATGKMQKNKLREQYGNHLLLLDSAATTAS